MTIRSCGLIHRPNAGGALLKPSRQTALAAKPHVFLRFQLRHRKQEAEHVEPVAPRQPGQLGGNIGNEGRGLIRTAVPCGIMVARTPIPALIRACAPAPCLGQKTASSPEYYWKILLLRAQLQGVFYNFRAADLPPSGAPSTSVDLTGAPSPPMFAAKRPTRISRNRPLFFP
jgi:hypothetical protein